MMRPKPELGCCDTEEEEEEEEEKEKEEGEEEEEEEECIRQEYQYITRQLAEYIFWTDIIYFL
jgi:hypothetical protein